MPRKTKLGEILPILAVAGISLAASFVASTLRGQDPAPEVRTADAPRAQVRLELERVLDSLSSVRVTSDRLRLVPEVGARYETQYGITGFYSVKGTPTDVLHGYLDELSKKGWTTEDEPQMILPDPKDDGTQIGHLAATAVKGQVRLFLYASENSKDPERAGTRLHVRVEPQRIIPAKDF